MDWSLPDRRPNYRSSWMEFHQQWMECCCKHLQYRNFTKTNCYGSTQFKRAYIRVYPQHPSVQICCNLLVGWCRLDVFRLDLERLARRRAWRTCMLSNRCLMDYWSWYCRCWLRSHWRSPKNHHVDSLRKRYRCYPCWVVILWGKCKDDGHSWIRWPKVRFHGLLPLERYGHEVHVFWEFYDLIFNRMGLHLLFLVLDLQKRR